ncbi:MULTISPECIES: hypothetical protein [Clostridium]|uniref:Uncharacterized protein n=1 Tax=Clostridium frigoriphilum TaxID=443253 RepID=A0ABU7UV56_9CLOT|nr:hypothetical protein [Clostridium sp. DSM 17811]MBU3102227.1 hypothetical protein [Clostridium sp. DSM 17811]
MKNVTGIAVGAIGVNIGIQHSKGVSVQGDESKKEFNSDNYKEDSLSTWDAAVGAKVTSGLVATSDRKIAIGIEKEYGAGFKISANQRDKNLKAMGYNRGYRRNYLRKIYNTEYLLHNAEIVTELCIKSKEEYRVWKELRRISSLTETETAKNIDKDSRIKGFSIDVMKILSNFSRKLLQKIPRGMWINHEYEPFC